MASPSSSFPRAPVEHASNRPFDETLERITGAFGDAGLQVFARIDHAAKARDVGLQMPPTAVLLYGNAKGGTPAMLAAPGAALDLPLRVLVRADGDGRSVVSFWPVVDMLIDARVPAELAARLQPAQDLLVRAVRS